VMTALIVFESMFGNTAAVAGAVANGLRECMEVDVRHVSDAPDPHAKLYDLLVVGGPTHAFSMSRSKTRADAVRQGADADPSIGLREWLAGLGVGPHSEYVAEFDTRVGKVRHLPGSAAHSAARVLHEHGFRSALGRASFFVADVAGPLLAGELERAREWGRTLGDDLSARARGEVLR
jgi:flavodoxin